MKNWVWVLVTAVLAVGCDGRVQPRLSEPSPLDIAEQLRRGAYGGAICVYGFIHEAEELQSYPGYFLSAIGCHTLPKWTLTPEPKQWHTYHRPFDIGQNNPDPSRHGNYAQILTPGRYWVEVEFENSAYGATVARVVEVK